MTGPSRRRRAIHVWTALMPINHPDKKLTTREKVLGALIWGSFIAIGIAVLYEMDVLVGG
jgi:hypothetical protein